MQLDAEKIAFMKIVWNDYKNMTDKEKKNFKQTAPTSVVDIITKLEQQTAAAV